MAHRIACNTKCTTAPLVAVAAVVLTAVNCDPGTAPTPAALITMSATIDGAGWVASTPKHGVPPYANYYAWDSALVVSGIRSYGSDSTLGIVLVLGPITGPGSLPLGTQVSRSYATLFRATGDIYAHTYKTRWYYTDDSTGGTATISGFDPETRHLDGSFSFTARDSTGRARQVTSGAFSGTWIASPPD